jgi:isopenicillin-N epimerase
MNRDALGLHWDLEPGLTFLNHGSFGLAPRELLQWRFRLLEEIERDPVAFLASELQPGLDRARRLLAQLVGASPAQLAFVPSTTYGLNELLQRLELPAGSEVLLSDHGYNATANLVRFACEQRGWSLRLVPIPLPLDDPGQVLAAFAAAWAPATRLVVVDHITSPSALALPLEPLIALARERGGRILVDGAHGPGLLPLRLQAWQPDAYVGNLHKWLCCPRGSAFLWVREPWQDSLRPLVVGHGANGPLPPGVSRFHLEHDWLGTADPTPWLALPEALRLLTGEAMDSKALDSQAMDSEPARLEVPPWLRRLEALQEAHRQLAQQGQALLLQALELDRPLAPAGMQAAMAALPLAPVGRLAGPALQAQLKRRGFQLPVIPLRPHTAGVPQFLRIACFAYNTPDDLERLAAVLPEALSAVAERAVP